MRRFIVLITILLIGSSGLADQPQLPRYETRYYILYTDVTPEEANEVALRMTRMAEEYHARTRDFSGDIRTKFPVYLYRHQEDYLAAGGLPGSAGYFDETALSVCAGDKLTDRTWHTMQHEGFHQFAAAVIGGIRPTWINEGLAEYFGEAIFTGDGFIDGVIPPWRLSRLKDEINKDQLLPTSDMMNLSLADWNHRLTTLNYDQAWSMIHFLAQGENGKYQHALAAMMVELSKGRQPDAAWNDNFGSAGGFEQQWKKYWLNLPDNPGDDLYAQATVARLTSFLARATAQKQTFASFDDFRSVAIDGKLKIAPADWLPNDLLGTALADVQQQKKNGAEFTLISKPAPQIQCKLPTGTRITGTFDLHAGIVVRADAKIVSRR